MGRLERAIPEDEFHAPADAPDITETPCWADCCANSGRCATGFECHHHKHDFDAARARAAGRRR